MRNKSLIKTEIKNFTKLRLWQQVLHVLIYCAFAGLCIIVFYHFIIKSRVYVFPLFQVTSVIEISFAFLTWKIPRRRRGLILIVWTIALVGPQILAANIKILTPIVYGVLVYLYALSLIALVDDLHSPSSGEQRKVQRVTRKPLHFDIILPLIYL